MTKIPKEVQEFLVRKNDWVAIATPFGTPDTALKASIRVVEEQHVVFADLFVRKAGESLQSRSKVTFAVADKATGKGYEIKGTAQRRDSGRLFERVAEKMKMGPLTLPLLKSVIDIAVDAVYDRPLGLQAGVRIA